MKEINIVASTVPGMPLNGNQETTLKSTYKKEIMSEINNTDELPKDNSPINLKLIQKYQRTEPSIGSKYKDGMFHKSSLREVSNIHLELIICKDNIFIPSKILSYVLHWYHTHLLHPGMDITEAMNRHHLYWTAIRYAICKEVTNCDTCKRTI